MRIGGGVKGCSLVDYYLCLMRYGAIVADYFEYEFWKKSSTVKKEYVTMLDAKRITRHFNKGRIEVFNDKQKFNLFFKEYHKLKDWYFPTDKKEEDFVKWVQDCKRAVLVKPTTGASGVGIYKPDVSTDEKIINLYQKLKDNDDCFCEEIFNQTGVLHQLNPSSLNTIRIYTLNIKGDIVIMNASVRIGAGNSVVDNIHSGGMVANIDLQKGWITDAAYNLTGERFLFHPFTGELIAGVIIPRFEEVKVLCKEAASRIHDVGFIAWDVAVSEETVCLIEGNNGGNFDAIQCSAQKGCRAEWMDAMKRDSNK